MRYEDLIDKVDKLEEESELTECIYYGAIKKLENVRKDLSLLDDIQHIRRVIKPFLIQWGMMGRVVGRKGLDWKKLGKKLRNLEDDFRELRNKKLLTINFNDKDVSNSIKRIYRKIRKIKYIGGHTCAPKILHLLNPEIFVMWDEDIKKNYKKKNNHISDSPQGYLEFLKEIQKDLKIAIEDYKKKTGKRLDEIEIEIRKRYKNKTLARIIDEYNWILAHPIKE